MKPRLILKSTVLLVIAFVLFDTACNKTQRTDSQVATDVQGKINADNSIHNKQLSVAAANGVVTLSGSVGSDAERSAVATDAASVNGVRTVVNNLTVQPADTTAAQNQPPAPDVSQPSPVQQAPAPTRSAKPSGGSANQNNNPLSQADAMKQQAAQQQDTARNVQNTPLPVPAPPPPPEVVRIPEGTPLSVRLIDTVDSENASPGDTFTATLNSPVEVNGRIVIPSDADLDGRVVDAQAAGRFRGRGMLTIEITRVRFNGRSYAIHTDQWSKQTDARGKGTAEKVGGGAALGAIIGGIAGGGRGAGIGAAVGAGAGGVTQAATRAAQIKLGPESLLSFRLAQPATVQPSSGNDRNADRRRLE